MVGYIPIWFTRPQTVTHPGTNQVRRSATTLIEANALPLSQTANHWHGTDARTDMAKTCCLCCSIQSFTGIALTQLGGLQLSPRPSGLWRDGLIPRCQQLQPAVSLQASPVSLQIRVTTCLENLEMSGNLTAVREMSGILLKVREKILSGKSCLELFIVSCIFASIQVFSRSLFCVKY